MHRAVFSILVLLLTLFAVMVLVETNIVYGAEYGSKSLIVVPRDYPTIQEAVDNAPSGALILVYSGVYRENIIISGKTGITIEGELGTVIEGYIYVYSSSSIVLRNLAIKTGSTGVSIYKAKNVTVEKCNLTYTGTGSLKPPGIYVWQSSNVTVNDTVIRDYVDGISIYKGSNITVVHSTIYASVGIYVSTSHNVFLEFNTIHANRGIYISGLIGLPSSTSLKLVFNRIIGSAGTDTALYMGGSQTFIELYITGNEIYYPKGYLIRNLLPDTSNVSGYAYLNTIYVKNTDYIGITWHSPGPLHYVYNGRNYTGYLGNYWYQYNGSDTDGDGVGDIPFSFNGLYDPYPIRPGASIINGFEFTSPDEVAVYLWNGSSITMEYSLGASLVTGYAEYMVLLGEERYELEYPVNATIFMNKASNGFRIVSTTRLISIIESRYNNVYLWYNMTLDEPGLVAVYVPEDYMVVNVYKNGVSAGYVFNETSRTLTLGDPVNVSILLLNNAAGDTGGNTGGGEVPPMPEPPFLPVIVMSAVLAGIVLKKRR